MVETVQSKLNREGRVSGAYAWISGALGLVILLNFRSHIDGLKSLSESLHWVVGWYHAIVHLPFRWLSIAVPQTTVDALMMTGLLLGNAQLQYMKRGGEGWLVPKMIGCARAGDNALHAGARLFFGLRISKAQAWFSILVGAWLSAMPFLFMGRYQTVLYGYEIKPAVVLLFLIMLLPLIKVRSLLPKGRAGKYLWFLANLPGVYYQWFALLGLCGLVFRTQLIRILFAFVVVLAVDAAFIRWGDPLFKLLADLPQPPG